MKCTHGVPVRKYCERCVHGNAPHEHIMRTGMLKIEGATTGHFSNREKITALLTEWKFVNKDALNSEQITDKILREVGS